MPGEDRDPFGERVVTEQSEWGEFAYGVPQYTDEIIQQRIVSVTDSHITVVGRGWDNEPAEHTYWIFSEYWHWCPSIEQAETVILRRAERAVRSNREGLKLAKERLATFKAAKREDYYTPCKETN